jgi:hypothetical protein
MKPIRVLAGASVALAATAAIAVPSAASLAAASARSGAAVSGTEHFQLMTTSATATTIPVIAYGLFTAAGVDHTGNNVDTLVFRNGSFKINHAHVPVKQTFNPKTCLLTVTGSGPVTLFGGTGAFKGISGKPVAALSILAIAARSNGKCSMTKPPASFQQLIKASGKISV